MADAELLETICNQIKKETKDFEEIVNKLYHLSHEDADKLDFFFKSIKSILIDKYKIERVAIVKLLTNASSMNHRSSELYWNLLKLCFLNFSLTPSEIDKLNTNLAIYFQGGISLNDLEIPYQFRTPEKDELHHIIMYDDIKMFLEYILKNDLKPNELYHFTNRSEPLYPIECCSFYGSVNIFYHLLNNFNCEITTFCMEVSFIGSNIDIINECIKVKKPNKRAVKNAIYSYNNEILMETLEKFDLNISCKSAIKSLNEEAMLLAIKYNFEDFILYLSSFPFQHYSIPLLKIYIESHEDVKNDINKLQPILLSSIINNRYELCKFLLSLNIDANYDKFEDQPLQYAAIYNRKEIAELLISHGADINQKNENGWTPLQRSVYFNNIEITKILLSHNCDINLEDNNGCTALHNAVRDDMIDILNLLIQSGAKIDTKDIEGMTPFYKAVLFNSLKAAEVFLQNGAEINIISKSGKSLLHESSVLLSTETVQFLISHEIDINVKNLEGITPLALSILNQNEDIAEFLIDHNANVNIVDNKGFPILYYAIYANMINIADKLIEKGANVKFKFQDGSSLLEFAEREGLYEFIVLLINKGAKRK